MDGNGAGLSLIDEEGMENPERPALSGKSALCGMRMTEAALSILCNVSCHQN